MHAPRLLQHTLKATAAAAAGQAYSASKQVNTALQHPTSKKLMQCMCWYPAAMHKANARNHGQSFTAPAAVAELTSSALRPGTHVAELKAVLFE
jgi:hypothetical protein